MSQNTIYVYVTLVLSGIGWALVNINLLLAASTSPTIVGALMDVFGMTVMFIFTPAFMALAFLLMFGVKRSEPWQAVSTLAAAVETAGDADFYGYRGRLGRTLQIFHSSRQGRW